MGDKLMTTKNINDAILAINPTAIFKIDGNEIYENIEWQDGTTPISKADVDAKLVEVQAAEDAAVAQLATDKASAKAKLIAGEALTEAEADTIVI